MPKPSRHALIWSEAHQHYELQIHGHPEQCFSPGDEPVFSRWLDEHTAFAFLGQAGRISVLKEARRGGRGYWYACRTHHRHTGKRYLGSTEKVTLVRLEEVAKALASEPAPIPPVPKPIPPSSDEQRVALLFSKLSPPRLPLTLVERERLLRELDAALTHPLTLVSASAGSGKTTLLSAWAAASGLRPPSEGGVLGAECRRAEQSVAWLSLDALDNDPVRFWASIIMALRGCQPMLGEEALTLLHSPHAPPLATILAILLNEIMQVDQEVIFILDDYHVIEEQAIHHGLLFLLDHLPANLHLVLATRTDPELPLARLRVRGQMVEIRSSDLRFTEAEAASFLVQSMSLPLTEEDVSILSKRTEGWIAGLHLAALSLRKRQDLSSWVSDFEGSHRYLLDYVQQDILAQLPVPLQDFLLQTSILTRMNAAACQAVTTSPTREASQQMLEEVERANLFVVPLDEQRQWYRYHDLFREALLARLQASQPELVPLLHLRAAGFYERASWWREAIAHALAAPDYAYAASLMEQAAPQFWLSGEARTVLNWVLCLPDTVLRGHTRLVLNAALRFLNSIHMSTETPHASMGTQVERIITRMEELLRRKLELSLSGAEVALIGRRLRLLRASIEARAIIKLGDTERLRHLAQETEALPSDEEVNWNMIPLFFTSWLTVMLQGEGASLIPRLQIARQVMSEARDPLATIRVMSWLALAYAQAARLHLAQQECLETLALIEQIDAHTFLAGSLYYCLFNISYARNRLEEASDWLQRLQRSAQDWQQVDLLVRGGLCSTQLALARGDISSAEEALHQLEALVEQEGFAYHTPWVSALRVQWWLAQAKLEQASAWAEQTTFSEDAWNPVSRREVLLLVRVYLSQQQYARAFETLSRFREHLDRSGDIETTIEFLSLSVVALYQSGKREQAARVAARLLALTEPEGHLRIYLDAGEPMSQMLLTLLSAQQEDGTCAEEVSISRPYVERLLAAFEQGERKFTQAGDASPVTAHKALPHLLQNAVQGTLIEPLSRQEQQVLRRLCAGQTYAEMAEALVVSINTIKTQVSSIYRKLGVSRRAEAITVTERLHLL